MNVTTLTGNVGKDPEIKTFPDTGRKQAIISLATKRRSSRRAGEDETTDWHRVVVNDTKLVETYVEPYVRKGALIGITGELTYEKFRPKDAAGIEQDREVKITQIVVTDPRGVQIHRLPSTRHLAMAGDEDFIGDGEAAAAHSAETP